MRKITLLLIFSVSFCWGQTITDTIQFMHYNLLNYRNITNYCTSSNNSPTNKDDYMKTIVGYLMPDIITVNEMVGDGGTGANRLLTNALNQDGRNFYKQANYSANSSLSNMLYYNKNKFMLVKQDKIDRALNKTQLVRQIDVYTLYYLDNSELELGDTNYLTIYVAHLKAGNTSSNVSERAQATESIMDYHSINYQSNHSYIISGDFNTYTSNEQGFINLVGNPNASIRFKDPIKKSGSWNNNSSFASIHTQSTRVSSNCHSGGGLDDRFDFVLCGQEIISNERGYGYVIGSYEALGNDGRHFNANLNSGSNSSVPGDVLDALYKMSDHLPVSLQLKVNRTTAHSSNFVKDNYLIMNNPVRDLLTWKMQLPMEGHLSIIDIHGKCLFLEKINPNNNWHQLDLTSLTKGIYTAIVTSGSSQIIRKKLVKL
ncbi:MAG: T9SS type A sorting domain-containing protein [Bacteroidia bacterium]|jgi:endonuclease/exonuclease/phosphatase family metal-dependent hydrolase|nr:T9SS type A sorting domain-containing protein [Bacteroidia bacterium]MDG2041967.1 T9SS type A sorting domain-containing protein [Bacteroidia bacterium]